MAIWAHLSPSARSILSRPSPFPSMPRSTSVAATSPRIALVARHMASSPSGPSSSEGAPIPTAADGVVLQSTHGAAGTIMLNRPKALNSLNMEMIKGVRQAVENLANSPSCNIILLRGEGRALCAGGDILALTKSAASPDPAERKHSADLFKAEFELDHRIAKLVEPSGGGKPFVSVMDGITMGGGAGLSIHAPFRVATEKTLFAMPETGIGYYPDVGASRVLARMDGNTGMFAALTGARISGPETYLAGIATHYLPSASLPSLFSRLSQLSTPALEGVNSVLEELSTDPLPSLPTSSPFIGAVRQAVDTAFSKVTVEEVMEALEKLAKGKEEADEVGKWAKQTLETLRTKSPTSLKVSMLSVREGIHLGVDDVFRMDMRVATAFLDVFTSPDFKIGVSHTLEKDPVTGKKKEGVAPWQPRTLAEVDVDVIRERFFGQNDKIEVPLVDLAHSSSPSTEIWSYHESGLNKKKGGQRDGPSSLEVFPEHDYNKFALPSEAEISRFIRGEHEASGSGKVTEDELVRAFERETGGKKGVETKVRDVVRRRCEKDKDGYLNWTKAEHK